MTAIAGTLHPDAAIWRRVIQQIAEDRQRVAFWAAVARGTSMVTRWQSVEQRERAMLARTRANEFGEICARLRADSAKLREQRASSSGSTPLRIRP